MAKLISAVANTTQNTGSTSQKTHWVSITKTSQLNVPLHAGSSEP